MKKKTLSSAILSLIGFSLSAFANVDSTQSVCISLTDPVSWHESTDISGDSIPERFVISWEDILASTPQWQRIASMNEERALSVPRIANAIRAISIEPRSGSALYRKFGSVLPSCNRANYKMVVRRITYGRSGAWIRNIQLLVIDTLTNGTAANVSWDYSEDRRNYWLIPNALDFVVDKIPTRTSPR